AAPRSRAAQQCAGTDARSGAARRGGPVVAFGTCRRFAPKPDCYNDTGPAAIEPGRGGGEAARMPIIEAKDLTKIYRVFQKKEGLLGAVRGLFRREYKEVRAVDGVSFAIEPGEMVAFLGPNGAGKTTTLKLLSGIIYPTSGTAQVLGFVPWERANAFRRRFSLVMGQTNQLCCALPAADS